MNVSKEQFNLWKHDPVTKLFLQFLRDKQRTLIEYSTAQWLCGAESFAGVNQTVRGQVVELGEIAELEFVSIEAFYKTEEENVTSAEDTERTAS